jgi:hypothetical protein
MKYVKCPLCELNYMKTDKTCCTVCDPKMKGRLLVDEELAYQDNRQSKLEEYEARRKQMEAYYAYRYNRVPNC